MDNNKKAILLTGVSGGIGFEVAKSFINKGYIVFGLDMNDLPEQLEGLHFIKTDLTKEKEVLSAFEEVKKSGYTLSNIVCTAGVNNLDSLVEISEEEFINMFNVNVFSLYRINKTFLPLLEPHGKIIMISSELAPLDPLPYIGLYGISKSLVEKYAYALRMELQLLGYKVVLIRPGAIDTKMIEMSNEQLNRFVDGTKYYKTNSQRFKKIVNSVESRKIPPRKVADLIYKVSLKKNPKYVYKINRNPSLIILSILPKRLQNWIIRQILTAK